jgi:hypothetical protein
MPTTTAMTNTLESLLLNTVLNGTPYDVANNRVLWVGILSAAGSDSSQTQMSGSARASIAFQTSSGGSAVSNTGVITFTNSGWASTSVYGVGFFNISTLGGSGDTCLLYGNFDSVVTVGAGQSLQFNIGGITISMD